MADIPHASLTGAQLHEPKGVAAASAGQVYIANGSGSGAWTSVEGLTITGMIADFATPIAPDGWLECDGTAINTTTYSALYNAMTIQRTGTRGAGSPIITGLSSTTGIKAGYYAFGTGIAAGTTVLTVDGASQVTLSANAASTGTATVVFSPWALDTGTIELPDLNTSARYRRARSTNGVFRMGMELASQNQAHAHSGSAVTTASSAHTHHGTTDTESASHQHAYDRATAGATFGAAGGGVNVLTSITNSSTNTGLATNAHVHGFNTDSDGTHIHGLTIVSDGGSEARPISLVVMTCVKT